MKKLIIFIIIIFINPLLFAGTVTIGSGIGSGGGAQSKPFGMWKGYERSAAIYTSAEIGTYGFITSLGWEVGIADLETCPTKIYLKQTSSPSSTLSSATWNSMISGATLVFDGITTFPATGWKTIDIAGFAYSANSLIVLCETNYGVSGATSYPEFNYNYYLSTHESWQSNGTAPTTNGTVDDNRPNIQITLTPLVSPVPPSGFMAKTISSTQVDLSWKRNTFPDNVMVAYNTDNTFGTPSGTYISGDTIPGGGVVLYNGSVLAFSQTTGLSPATTYYYRAWSVHAPTPTYSTAIGATAATFCDPTGTFPYLTDFENGTFPPMCWSLAGKPWTRYDSASAHGIGTKSVKADFFNVFPGYFDLISPKLDLTTLSNPTVTFDHAYATDGSPARVDKLELYYSTNNGTSYTLLTTWLGGTGPLNTGGSSSSRFMPTSTQWAMKSYILPAGTNKVRFRGISANGNNLYLDSISFGGTCLPPTSPTASNITASSADLSWTPVGATTTWEIKWGDAGFNPATAGTLVTPVNSNPYTLDGLQSLHAYAFYVRSNCSGIPSTWAGPYNFSTTCGTYPIPYSENFDSYTAPAFGCNTVTDDNTDNVKWKTSNSYPRSSPNSMYINTSTSAITNDWFFTPGLNLDEGTTYAVNFYYRGDASKVEKLEVKWSSSPNAADTLGLLWRNTNIQTGTYSMATAYITPATTSVYYVGWHAFSANGKKYLCVDDISIVSSIIWNGSVSTNWNTPGNWTPAIVPPSDMQVTIPVVTSPAVYPNVNVAGLACKDLTISGGATVTVSATVKFTINGNLTIMEGGTLANQGTIILKGNLDNQNP